MTVGSSKSSENEQVQFDITPLSWVIGELRDALLHAGNFLKNAIEQDVDTQATTLLQAKSYLHQAHGALQVVEVEGVSIVTETVEELIENIQAGKLKHSEEVATTIVNSFNAVLHYLEDLLIGAPPLPVRLFPEYRELLELKGAERIHPADLFFPSLSIQEKIPELTLSNQSNKIDYSSLRLQFEKSLLVVLTSKDQKLKNNAVKSMGIVIQEIVDAQSTSQHKAFWLVLRAFSESSNEMMSKDERHVKQIWGRINLQIRRLVERNASIPERLLRDALFFIAQVEEPTDFVGKIKKAYQLENNIPKNFAEKKYGLFAPNVLVSTKEHLSHVKNLWGRISNGDASLADKFSHKINDLALNGIQLRSTPLSNLFESFKELSTKLVRANQKDGIGIEFATALLFVDNALNQITHLPSNFSLRSDEIILRLNAIVDGKVPQNQATWMGEISKEAQQKETIDVLVQELQSSLKLAEKGLDDFFREPSNSEVLIPVDRILSQIGGALAMLDQDDAGKAVEFSRNLVKEFSNRDVDLSVNTFEDKFKIVAQNIGALSFFLETLQSQPEIIKKRFLFDAEKGIFLTNLVSKSDDKELLPHDLIMEVESKQHSSTVEEELIEQQKESNRLLVSLVEKPEDSLIKEKLKHSLDNERSFAALLDDTDASSRASKAIDLLDHADLTNSPNSLNDIVAATTKVDQNNNTYVDINIPESDEAIDAELLEIFLIEADEVLAAVDENIPLSKHDQSNQEFLIRLRRSFHTLKGSGRMVGLFEFGESAWNIEQVMNFWLSESKSATDELYKLLDYASAEMHLWVSELKNSLTSTKNSKNIIYAANQVKEGNPFALIELDTIEETPQENEIIFPEIIEATVDEQIISITENGTEISKELEIEGSDFLTNELLKHQAESSDYDSLIPEVDKEIHEINSPTLLEENDIHKVTLEFEESQEEIVFEDISLGVKVDDDFEGQVNEEKHSAKIIEFPDLVSTQLNEIDSTKKIGDVEISLALHTIYMAETDEIVRFLTNDFSEWRHEATRSVSRQTVNATHTLAGSSATVGLYSVQEIAHSMENVLQRLERHPVVLNIEEFDLLEEVLEIVKLILHKFGMSELVNSDGQIVQKLNNLLNEVIHRSNSGEVEEFITSTNEIVDPDLLVSDDRSIENDVDLIDEIAGVENKSTQADSISDKSLPLETEETVAINQPEIIESLENAVELQHQEFAFEDELEVSSNEIIGEKLASTSDETESNFESNLDEINEEQEESESKISDDIDLDLLPVFIEEGNDLLPMVGQLLRSWQQAPEDDAIPQSILRLMHTIKGSARMAGAMTLGQHTHDMEARIENLMHTGGAIRSPLLDDLLSRQDYSMQLFERLQNPDAPPLESLSEFGTNTIINKDVDSVIEKDLNLEKPVVANESQKTLPPLISKSVVSSIKPNVAPLPSLATNAAATSLVRVRADILDRLVNQAGEVSISRSKLESEVDTLRSSLTELTDNVSRLRDQLREVEIQAEKQITSRMELSGDREFDPLEFDRFTRLQELTRMMAESVNDVATVQTTLGRTIDGASNDLHTQARLTRELQQDLMRVRMIPFSSVSERLYRIARQTSKELDKRVNLDIRGTSVEVDRGVLEKMTAPFEHMLRNAIVHGIESKKVRLEQGKSEVGELLIEIRQEGNEVVIHFTDDGQGLNLNRIREKAQSVGLLTDESQVGESEIVNLIFEPGFSTASEITEIAGRGVGMDVVRSEAAALGGRVSVVSEEGKGAHFTIHLPLTLAVTQVVIISAGGKVFAVPSVLVEQVQQLKSTALANAYNDGAIMWQGNRVPMHYLPTMLGERDAIPDTLQYTPVLIMKSDKDRVAVHVDKIIGNREVVVKNVGPQLSRMIGIAGATVMGSGDIVLILNPVPLAQKIEHERAKLSDTDLKKLDGEMGSVAEISNGNSSSKPVQGLRKHNVVMVVDDSLTVRRVTQRLLLREGYQVVLAKDGIDALEQLQSVTPDVMLLDIEMPRMDGFDLTRNMRSDSRTENIPIIMITSRTADKHRNYAAELGVNEYFGKPYRETELLAAISSFINKEVDVS
jgi:chemosensory pili system protein ChpA (sensor histidine kinase/response regulator)